MRVHFLDLGQQYREIKKDMDVALKQVMRRCDFILGKDVTIFEKEFARYCNRRFAVGLNSGTDALFLGLLSLGIGPGDEVIVPAFTYIASALAISFTGAKPVFVDINEDTYNIDVNKIRNAITKKTKAIIPVHLYGQPVDMKPILDIAKEYNLKVIEDAAQAHGATYKVKSLPTKAGSRQVGKKSKVKNAKVGSLGDIGCFSFYPTKNLGAFGDGGMVVTDNEDVYKKLLMLRDYGRKSRYEHVTLGYNSRLDTLQAAILRIKLKRLNRWNAIRRKNAKVYTNKLKGIENIIVPYEASYGKHVYHIYVIRVKNRDAVIKGLTKNGIGVFIHYPIPLHLQKVYKELGYKRGDFPVAEKAAKEVISLPMYPHLKETQIKFIADTLKTILK
jgi:dTDP-4-amino-4,6-dideoxygalactose transaminase